MNEIFTKSIIEVLKSPLNDLMSEFSSQVKQFVNNRLLEYQVELANRNLFVKTLLFRDKPVYLYDIYQDLYIRSESLKSKIHTKNISDVFSQSRFVTLIGYAGSGKSMLLKHLFIDCLKSNFKYPITIELRYLNDYSGTLTEYVHEKIFEFHKLGSNEKIIDKLLSSGKFVIFFDGYDEIKSNKKGAITDELNEFVKLFNKNNYIITSRPSTGAETIPLFHNYWLQTFQDDEIKQFIQKQLKTQIELSNKIIQAILLKENKAYYTFLQNPLLLTMFIISFNTYSEIPAQRSLFYRQVFDTLYLIHDSSSKLAFVREKISGLSKELFEKVLQTFSFLSFFEYKFEFSVDYLYELFGKIKKNKNIEFDNDKFITDLNIALGILVKEGFDFSFSHRSLQEYFTALYISNLADEHKSLIYNKIENLIWNNYIGLNDYYNLYILLYEMDNKDFTKLLLLPNLAMIKNFLNSERIDKLFNNNQILDFFKNKFGTLCLFFKMETDFQEIDKEYGDIFVKLVDWDIENCNNQNDFYFQVRDDYKILYVMPLINKYINYLNSKEVEYRTRFSSELEGDLNLLMMI